VTKRRGHIAEILGLSLLSLVLCSCGGSSSSSGGPPPPPPPPPPLTITDTSPLPGAMLNQPYSVTLHAVNGTGALTWAIAPMSPTALFVTGLTIDPSSGVLSGTAGWGGGTAGFLATVKDSASHIASKSFLVGEFFPMQSPTPQSFTIREYGEVYPLFTITPNGGVPPFTFTVTGGAFPTGVRIDSNGMLRGSAIVRGNFVSTITIQDSFTPPETVPAQVSFSVLSPFLSVASSLPQSIPLNRPFSGRVVAVGGVPPYHYSLSGNLPAGLGSIDPNSGTLSGTPTSLGNSFFTVNVTDSDSPPSAANNSYSINVVNPLGRNDTVATATPISNGSFQASISPYIDPPTTPEPGDNDYYKIVSVSGAVVHVETLAQRLPFANLIDTVMEIVDGNGTRLSACRLPGATTTAYTSSCINDDIGGNPYTLDSALDFQVPGAPSTPTTFYVHVLDWRGDARPDMLYNLSVNGVNPPLSIQATLFPGTRGVNYSVQLTAGNATGNVAWSLAGGNLPAGLTLNTSGLISGQPTADGLSSFMVQATDSSTPPQVASAQESIQIVEPVKITSPAAWPDACVNQPYTFTLQYSGGLAPYSLGFSSLNWPLLYNSTPTFSGTPNQTGAFQGTVTVTDAARYTASQNVTLTVKSCP